MIPKIKTFEAACKALKLNPAKVLPTVTTFPVKHRNALVAHAKLIIIAEALNEGWQPNWNDSSEWKYYPWFEVKADEKNLSGSGLAYYVFAYWLSLTAVGSRLCFKSRELAEYAGKQFKKLYEEYFLIGK